MVVVVVVVVLVVEVVILFTEKHDKSHETDNNTHTCPTNIYPSVSKCIEAS